MKTFKRCDFWISIGLLVCAVLYGLLRQDLQFLLGYFILGFWQVVSMLLHIYNHWFTKKGSKRNAYNNAIIVLLVLLLLGCIIPVILYVLMFFLLFAAPVMALYYIRICYLETYIQMQRPLALLK